MIKEDSMKKTGMALMAALVAVTLAAGTSYAGSWKAQGQGKKHWACVPVERCPVVVREHRRAAPPPPRPAAKVVLKMQMPPCRGNVLHERERRAERRHETVRPVIVIAANIPVFF
jgi:hypothetical protein